MGGEKRKKMKSERRKSGKVSMVAVFFAIAAFVSVSVGDASATEVYVLEGGNQTIQQAVDNATAGDTIIVRDGTYTENVDVGVAHLTIRSENGSVSTTVQAASSNDYVFEVTTDYVNISGFTVTGATGNWKAGIYLGNGVDYCNISSNNASNNDYGIYLHSSSNNTLTNNTANSNNYYGIYLYSSSSNTIYNNYFNNTNNAYDDGTNIWNITKQAGTNIIGGSWLGGNYWSDYEGEDLDGDGLGDTLLPYDSSGDITNGGDYLPLVSVGVTPPAFTTADAVIALGIAVGSRPHDDAMDVNGDGSVTSLDALMILQAAAGAISL